MQLRGAKIVSPSRSEGSQPNGKAHEDGRLDRSRRTRANIRRAAGELIIKQGLDGTTVDEICAAAGVAKGTFYLHFRSKGELILEYGNRRLEHVQSVLPEILLLPTVRESLHKMVTLVVKGKDWHPDIVRAVVLKIAQSFNQMRAHDLRQLLVPLIELGVGRDELRDDIPVPILASFVADTIYCGMRNWGMGLSGDDLDQAIDHAVELAWDAVRRHNTLR